MVYSLAHGMDVRSDSPLTVGSLVFQSASGAWVAAIVAKASFLLVPGESPLLPDGGDPVAAADVPWEPDGPSSLRFASDLVPYKRYPEVLLIGSAFAPRARPTRSIMARLAVGAVDKLVEIQGNSHFDLDGTQSEPSLWTRMPLRWERAAGGPGTSNPAGIPTGSDARPDEWGRFVLPNLWPPWSAVSGPQDTIASVGLGPLSPDWPARRARLHRHLATWTDRSLSERPLPADFDVAYFNSAPQDQLLTELGADASILLEHLHPEHARLTTRLARTSPIATAHHPSGRALDVSLAPDTLLIDTDRGIATLTFRGHVALDSPTQAVTVVVHLPKAISLPAPPAPVPTPVPTPAPAGPALPGLPGIVVPALAIPVLPLAVTPAAPRPRASQRRQTLALDNWTPGRATPFEPAPGTASLDDEDTPHHLEEDDTLTPIPGDSPLRFTGAALAADDAVSLAADDFHLADDEIVPASRLETTITSLSELLGTDALPFARTSSPEGLPAASAPSLPASSPPASSPPAPAPAPETTTFAQLLHARTALAATPMVRQDTDVLFVPAPTAADAPIAPPPLWAGVESASLDPASDLAAESAAGAAAPAAPPPEPEPSGPPPLPLDDYPITRCAAITASLHRKPDLVDQILRKESLDLATWQRLDEHWAAALKRDLLRQRTTLLRQQDAGYLERLEAERGPIAAADYAKLTVAADVGTLESALQELDIPEPAWPHVKRTWIARMAKDPRLATLVRQLVDQQD